MPCWRIYFKATNPFDQYINTPKLLLKKVKIIENAINILKQDQTNYTRVKFTVNSL